MIRTMSLGLTTLMFTAALAGCGLGASPPAPSHGGSKSRTSGNKVPTTLDTKHKGKTSLTKKASGLKPLGTKGKKGHGHKSKPIPVNLAYLPPLKALKSFNPALKHYHRISTFIPGMGMHWASMVPGVVLMTNTHADVTAVEASFPQKLGTTYSWLDPLTTVPNAGVAMTSEHLYFTAPAGITPTMAAMVPSDLGSWAKFLAVNPRLSVYVKQPTMFHGLSIYAPPTGPSLKVLVSGTGSIAGFMVSEPAKWGWSKEYWEPKGKPTKSKLFGKAYHSVLWLTPMKATGKKP